MTTTTDTTGRAPAVPPAAPAFGNLKGHVKNTVKDLVSVLKGHYHGAEVLGDPALIQKTQETDKAPEYWKDWRWQVRHAVRDLTTFQQLLGITFGLVEREQLEKTIQKFPLSITPYYLSLIDVNDYKNDPIFKQAFPSPAELIVENYELADPLAEDKDSPCDCITHRYPDRVLFLISNTCAMYCRHCTRKRKVGDVDSIPGRAKILEGIDYIRNNPQIRDVLLSGGDPFMLSDEHLDWILTELSAIPHVELIRIGTRVPVVLPFRVTDDLVAVLKKHRPVWVNTQFNHPKEMTESARAAVARLADAGIPLGNQSVLLAGINDCPRIMKELVHQLVKNRIRPYYLYQCDLSEGISHFRTPVSKGIEIMENLIGHTSGFAVPRYVVDAPGGGGKIPVSPNYLLTWSVHKVVLRNYEGMICTNQEPANYERIFCNGDCIACKLQLNIDRADESMVVGVAKLLADYDETTTLIPENNDRIETGGTMMQCDVVLYRGDSFIQHGHLNNRVYVMKLAQPDTPDIIRYVDDLTAKEGYTKIFVKVPESSVEIFSRSGYIPEATVPYFFDGKEPAVFMAKYRDPERKKVREATEIADVLSAAFGYGGGRSSHDLPDGFALMHAHAGDAKDIADLYRSVFKTYPFPVFDPEYILESMQGNTRYLVVKKFHQLAAIASCDIDAKNHNAEVTDFATGPLFRGKGLAGILLHAMEAEMRKEGVLLAYTIARAKSLPINATFAGAGYQFGGMLPNNTNICGSLESMNVWYKRL